MARALFQSRMPLFWAQIRMGLLPGDAGVAVGVSATWVASTKVVYESRTR
jgi:hypothetical protein